MSDPVPAARPRGQSAALILSLCINVALIAMIVVALIGFMGLRHAAHPLLGPRALLEQASPAERPKIEAIFDAHAARIRDLSRAAVDAHIGAFRVFSGPTFNRDAMIKALVQMQAADDALRAEETAMAVEAMAQLSTQERQNLAREVRQRAYMRRLRLWR